MARRRKIPQPHPHTGTDGRVRCRLRLDGRDYYCGDWGTPEAEQEADRLLARWLDANRGRLAPTEQPRGLTVAEVLERYEAEVMRGRMDRIARGQCRAVVSALLSVAGPKLAGDFSLDDFEGVRQVFVDAGWSLSYLQKQCRRVRQIFRWAAHRRRGLVPAAVVAGLEDPDPLPEGVVRETEVREPPSDALVDATLPHVLPVIAAMVQVQRSSGMRPGELCRLRLDELDTAGDVWLYEPRKHKTRRHGIRRRVWLGPRAQEVLRPWVEAARTAGREWVFPTHSTRPGGRYSPNGYMQGVLAGCFRLHGERCKGCVRRKKERHRDWLMRVRKCPGFAADRWSPQLLRSARLTEVALDLGPLHAKATGGHASLRMTDIYLRREDELAKEAARKSG